MSTKSSKAKAPKAKGGKPGAGDKDSITGLTITVDGYGSITSDKVYDKDSALIKNSLGITSDYLNRLQSFDAEVEFNKSYIVFTTKQVDADSKVAATRTVFQGNFQYANKRVKSARINYMAQFNDSPNYDYGSINRVGVTIQQPTNGGSWMSAINTALTNTSSTTAYFSQVTPTMDSQDYSDYPADESTGGGRAALIAFGNGRFFQEGWWQDPFAPHLI